jgi:transcriptional regulator with XRE-family HTH domain
MTRVELGYILAELRKEKGLSIRSLADKCEMSKSTIVNIEQGRFSPRVEIVDKICSALEAEIYIKVRQ